MNYQVFSYMPSASAASADPSAPRPIRVTPSALSPLIYAILYSIEFQSPVGPRPATLRDHSSTRGTGAGAGGSANATNNHSNNVNTGNGTATTGAAGAPSAAALLTSAVSVMSSFWGRSAATTTVNPTSSSNSNNKNNNTAASAAATAAHAAAAASQSQQQRSASVFAGGAANTAASFAGPARAFTLAEEAELAALQRQHEQPFVTPVIQVLHKLGGVHITVRETHNPTITTAYARAMEEVEAIVSEHEQRLARLSLRSASSFPAQPPGIASSPSPSALALMHSAGSNGPHTAATQEEAAAERLSRVGAPTASPASPTSPSRSMLRMGSPASGISASSAWAAAGSRGAGESGSPSNNNNNNTSNATAAAMNAYGARVNDDLHPSQEEVGLVLSVRLLSKEVTRWRITHERPLAEWRFPIIRTSNERMMIRSRAQSPGFMASSTASSVAAGFVSQDSREAAGDGGSAGHDYILMNDPAQMHQVLEFILKSSYQTTSMETFTDFTSGELVFDAHVQEKRRFV